MALYSTGVALAAVLGVGITAYLNAGQPEQFAGDHGTALGGAIVLSLLSWVAVATILFLVACLALYAAACGAAHRLRPVTVQVINPDRRSGR